MAFFAGLPGIGTEMISKSLAGLVPQQKGFLENLFTNKMFLQLLSAGGADLMQGTGGKNTLEAITKNIAGGSFKTIMQSLLAGKSPDSKVTIGGDGSFTFKAPGATPGTAGATPVSGTPAPTPTSNEGGMNDLNKLFSSLLGGGQPNFSSSLSGLSASDLAGLGPEEIAQALTIGQRDQQLRQQSVRDIADAMYNQGMLNVAQRNAAVAEARVPIEQMSEETEAANAARAWYDSLTKDERTSMEKEYDRAVSEGYKGKLEDWKVLSGDPEMIKLYNASVADGSWDPKKKGGLWQFIKSRAESGATRISLGEEVARQNALSGLQGPKYFDNPDWTKDIEKFAGSDAYWEEISAFMGTKPTNEQLEAKKEAVLLNQVQSKITSSGGKVVNVYRDKRGKVVWEAEWTLPNGTVVKRTIPYAAK